MSTVAPRLSRWTKQPETFLTFKINTMKKLTTLLVILYSSMLLGFSQAGGNEIYEQNNRYFQNKSYNETNIGVYDFEQRQEITSNTISNNYVEFEVNAIKNIRAKSFLAIFNLIYY